MTSTSSIVRRPAPNRVAGTCGGLQIGLWQAVLLHDHGAGDEIAQPLVAGGEEDGQHADRIDPWHLVDDAEQVAQERVEGRDRLARDRDHAQADGALAGRLAAPERLEGGEVAVVEQRSRAG